VFSSTSPSVSVYYPVFEMPQLAIFGAAAFLSAIILLPLPFGCGLFFNTSISLNL
jgi:hypothetical protein